jgi:hypothetical protein
LADGAGRRRGRPRGGTASFAFNVPPDDAARAPGCQLALCRDGHPRITTSSAAVHGSEMRGTRGATEMDGKDGHARRRSTSERWLGRDFCGRGGARDELNGGGGSARRRSGREEISTGAEEPRLNSMVVEAVRVGEVAGRRFPLAPRSAGSQ